MSTVVGNSVPEFRFRQYWQQVSGGKSVTLGRLPQDPVEAEKKRVEFQVARDAHEQKAFTKIVKLIQEGAPAVKPKAKKRLCTSTRTSCKPGETGRPKSRMKSFGK